MFIRSASLALLLSPPLAMGGQVPGQACVIRSVDELPPILLCQQNVSIPSQLFVDAFCRPEIPDRTFAVQLQESCPGGAYGVCQGARTGGVAYEQSIHYYSDPDDAPVLSAYCEQISHGRWLSGESSE